MIMTFSTQMIHHKRANIIKHKLHNSNARVNQCFDAKTTIVMSIYGGTRIVCTGSKQIIIS